MKAGRVLVVDDEPTMADGLRLVLEAEGYAVLTAATSAQAVEAASAQSFHLAIVDLVLPDGDGLGLLRELKRRDPTLEVIVITAHGSIPKAVEAIKDGAFYFVAKPFDPEEITALISKALERRWLVAEATDLKRRLAKTSGYGEILGSSPAMQRVFELMDAVANSDANVLIVGASGTGKELVADAIHARSARSQGPWVKINCAALPKDLIESELFGHVKGAFTGAATDKIGLLEEAHRGSLLLDEIAEMPLDLQAKLLRVLEERTVRRIGGSRMIPVDFRLITSSNREPEQALVEGRLRQDLYFRINTVTIPLPPLCERTGDIPLLARHYLQRFAAKHGRAVETISPEAYRRLLAHSWPGNVRELEHAIERAVLVARGAEIGVADLPESLGAAGDAPASSGPPAGSLEEIERASILRALESTNWNKQAAAALLGLRRPTLYSKMRKHGIPQRRA
ncbi:MAG: sigma-54-dependent Fis family transcriptional regulator [Candidatus Rokubacteria bacterium]|nr:sigma-54-dependent Fis family transcriptional regulator [Candidatus Rokubacteria bacterium]